jgi:hypothetical protein
LLSLHFLWVELGFQVSRVKLLAEWLVFIECCRAWFLYNAQKGVGQAAKADVEPSDAEFERRHGNAGWFENDKPVVPLTRFQRFMLWLGFERD